ncbi:MAG: MOSC domain-containing protein [Cytophagales bacterium]|jgi:MOSC domain-containing protein YiiM|nr:MOSC domain-containing protein [Cytophagales bacterium]MCA6366249.1 MOSC domain-containing protein [Cytophagales bacterium]MCA6371932.1 MOSC domain-containing protein [Cytophagales bacterium]MCA6376640.1 MOSC domain-containing protein [Cytophagales bacterium]MCA6383680.1 MOSC domain-containing protein [Cytophagales bacterium]
MEIKELMNQFAQPGRVVAISIRPERMVPVKMVDAVLAIQNKGLEGDRSKGGNRQVTFIQKEHIIAVASFLGKTDLDYTLTRRNVLVEGINLLSLKGKQFRIGEAVFEYSGECHPCSRMEEALGAGGYNAMRGHGGITAKIVLSGLIKINDRLVAKI